MQPVELHIRSMSRKWGSCSTRGRVTLNSELMTAPADLRREVIVEELLHLKVPNHGPLFKALKRAYLVKTASAEWVRNTGNFRCPMLLRAVACASRYGQGSSRLRDRVLRACTISCPVTAWCLTPAAAATRALPGPADSPEPAGPGTAGRPAGARRWARRRFLIGGRAHSALVSRHRWGALVDYGAVPAFSTSPFP